MAPSRAVHLKYGEYLVTLAGGQEFRFPGAVAVSAHITPDLETGIGRWSEQDFLDRVYQYKEYAENGSPQVGPESFTLMPWLNFAQLKPEDLKAIYAFLRTQQPIYHVVDSHPVWQAQGKRGKRGADGVRGVVDELRGTLPFVPVALPKSALSKSSGPSAWN